MAVLESLRNIFLPSATAERESIRPAPAMDYAIRPLTSANLQEVLKLNIRCFDNGDSYTKYTFEYLLSEPTTLSYRLVTNDDQMVGFAFVMVNQNNAAHLTTIGIAPEHRRRRLAERLLAHLDDALRAKGVGTVMLEVRVSNTPAQDLYRKTGYTVVQRISKYYNNGEDCFLMVKALN